MSYCVQTVREEVERSGGVSDVVDVQSRQQEYAGEGEVNNSCMHF